MSEGSTIFRGDRAGRASHASAIAANMGLRIMKQNTVFHILLGLAVVPTIALVYLLLALADAQG
jgi:hypothetical protein